MRRLLFDVTYTRTQRENVGIIRTVRRLLQEFRRSGVPVEPVVYARGEFRLAGDRELPAAGPAEGSAGLVFRLATSRPGKQAITLLSRLPWPLLRPIWELGTDRAYGADAATGSTPAQGDLVLLCDASWNYASWRAARRARRRGAAVVAMVHDLMPLRNPEFVAPLQVGIYRGWLREMCAASSALICNSATTEADLRAWAREEGVSLPPTGHFRLGADPRPEGAQEPVRPQLRAFLDGTVPCFAAVGSVEPKKNYGFLLDVFERLWAEGTQARLLVAGRVTAEWQALGDRLRHHAECGGRLLPVFDANDGEISAIYRQARALVFPSLMEGFGLPLVEARAAGCPVIASDLPVFAELADAGVFLYPRHSQEALAGRIREHLAADRRADTPPMRPFLWSDSAAQCLQVAQRLVASAGSAEPATRGAASANR